MRYIEVHIQKIEDNLKEIIVAFLPDYGFQQMEEIDQDIKAYALESDAHIDELKSWLDEFGLLYHEHLIEETNWNASWESNFQPVEIPGKILVRADFHPSGDGAYQHEILITPKMSFGTGHHATTKMMMEAMLENDFVAKTVLDFGTGTGILAILAEKLGAKAVLAIDNDVWSFENAQENLLKNHSSHIEVICQDHLNDIGQFDVVLANINKNVLLDQANALYSIMVPNGVLIISGLLSVDYEDICSIYTPLFGNNIKQYQLGEWIAISFNL